MRRSCSRLRWTSRRSRVRWIGQQQHIRAVWVNFEIVSSFLLPILVMIVCYTRLVCCLLLNPIQLQDQAKRLIRKVTAMVPIVTTTFVWWAPYHIINYSSLTTCRGRTLEEDHPSQPQQQHRCRRRPNSSVSLFSIPFHRLSSSFQVAVILSSTASAARTSVRIHTYCDATTITWFDWSFVIADGWKSYLVYVGLFLCHICNSSLCSVA